MRKPGSWRRSVLLGATGLVVLAGAYLLGFVTSDEGLFPSAHLLDVKYQLRRLLDASSPGLASSEINTALLRIAISSVQVDGDAELRGGGITPLGRDLLGVTGSGEFFLVRAQQVKELDITPPSRHLDEYRAAAQTPAFATLQHNFTLVRYHAPLHVTSGDGRQLLFITYTEWQPDRQCYVLALARLQLPGLPALENFKATAADWKVLFRTSPCLPLLTTHEALQGHMSGGAMVYLPDSQRLLLTTGDYRVDGVYAPAMVAQEDGSTYGRLLSLDLDGGSVTEIAKGLRNPEGLMVLADGTIWSTEHGPRGGDELNRIMAGGNYGWPYRTLGTRYSALPWPLSPTNGRHDVDAQYSGPVYAWVPSAGISGLARVEDFDPAWDGDFLVGSMRGQTLYRLRVTEGRVQYSEPIGLQDRIRQIVPLPDGVIALWTDSRKVLFLRPAATSPTLLRVQKEIALLTGGDDARTRRLEAALQRCTECHSLDPDAPGNIPHLNGIVGRAVASTSYAGYSVALRDAGGRWTRDRLAAFLSDPQEFAPGTPMPAAQLPAETLGDLIAVLERLNSPE